MQINSINSHNFGHNLKLHNSQPLKPNISFKGADKFVKSYSTEVFDRLKNFPNLSHKSFEKIAYCAEELAKKGNMKPKILVEMMVRFVETIEAARANGSKISDAVKENANKVYTSVIFENIANKIPISQSGRKKTFHTRWKFLAIQSVKDKTGKFKHVKPEDDMYPTKLPIKITGEDRRDMLEFLRKKWTHGNTAYRVIEKGPGLSGWVKYLREEFAPQYWYVDEKLKRKH